MLLRTYATASIMLMAGKQTKLQLMEVDYQTLRRSLCDLYGLILLQFNPE